MTWNLASIGTVVSEENIFENVDGRTTHALLYYKLTYEPKSSGELKIRFRLFFISKSYTKFLAIIGLVVQRVICTSTQKPLAREPRSYFGMVCVFSIIRRMDDIRFYVILIVLQLDQWEGDNERLHAMVWLDR